MQIDPLLKMVVEASTALNDKADGRFEPEITLLVGGMLVSGRIVSKREFLMNHPLTDGLLEAAEKLAKEEPSKQDDDALSVFIHLADARFFVPGCGPVPNNGVMWRCRLSEVAAFHFGTIRGVANNED